MTELILFLGREEKLLWLLLILGCVVSLFGCAARETASGQQVTVYYRRSEPTYGAEDSIIASTTMDASEDYTALLQMYLRGSEESLFAPTFPKETYVVSFRLDALTAKIVLSDNFARLSGMDLTIACICLTQTIISLTDCHEVIISTVFSTLDGNNFITLSRDSYLLLDSSGGN